MRDAAVRPVRDAAVRPVRHAAVRPVRDAAVHHSCAALQRRVVKPTSALVRTPFSDETSATLIGKCM
jgi:hypothetical protein